MAETPETKVKAKVKKLLKKMEEKGGVWSTALSSRYHSGLPDFSALIEGEANYIEAKAEGKPLTPLQIYVAKAILTAGGKYWMATIKENKLCLTEYLGRGRIPKSVR